MIETTSQWRVGFSVDLFINVATQCVFHSHALQMVGWLDERIQCGLLGHRDGDGGRYSKHEFRHNLHGNQAGRVLVQLISQRPIERLGTVQLLLGQSLDGAYFKRRNAIVHFRLQPAMVAEIELVLKILHDADGGCVTIMISRSLASSSRADSPREAWSCDA
jgi:hypothetical protein